MKFIWFKSKNGDVLEDAGIIEAKEEAEARETLEFLYDYDPNYVCLSFLELNNELRYTTNDLHCISLFELFERVK